LYVITHNEISLQYQVPQVAHAVLQFANDYPQEQKEWFEKSNTIVVLSAKNLVELEDFSKKLDLKGIRHSKFKEPDIGNKLTAIAIVPNEKIKKICSKFKLAGSE
jgi:peptidyl-tRNA hydrolase